MRNSGLEEAQAGIKMAGRNINNLRYAYDTILMTASLLAQTVKRLPAIWETWLRSLGQEDPLEKEMAPHSSTLAWKIPWTERLVCYSPWSRKESDMTERLHLWQKVKRN